MIDAHDIKDMLTADNIFKLLEDLGVEPIDKNNRFECLTLCHGGDSHKLFYYKDSKKFMCFTNCGSMDIFSFIERFFDRSFIESVKYVQDYFNLYGGSTTSSEVIENPVKLLRKVDIKKPEIRILDDNIMNAYYEKYCQSWVEEGISLDTMKKFDIRYSIVDNQIIIPHRNASNQLIGVRARNLNQDQIAMGRKYIPVFYKGESLKYPTGENLYGLNVNKEAINRAHKIVLFEAEKSVMKLDSCGLDIGVGLNGSHLGDGQKRLLDSLDINEIIVALDKEYKESDTKQSAAYAMKIASIFKSLTNKFNVSVLWDRHGLLEEKDSPIDKGIDVFKELYKERIYL